MKKLLLLFLLPVTACASRIERVIKISEPKTVKIGVVYASGQRAVCSGAFVTATGVVLTCAHCFEHGDISKVFVKTSDKQVYIGLKVLGNAPADLALVLPDLKGRKVPFFKLGKRPIVGQQVIALGSPLDIQGVSSIGWVEKILKSAYTFVLHSAFVNPGNSGGPLVNLKGQLVGINEAILGIDETTLAQGMYIAIDVETIKTFLYGDK